MAIEYSHGTRTRINQAVVPMGAPLRPKVLSARILSSSLPSRRSPPLEIGHRHIPPRQGGRGSGERIRVFRLLATPVRFGRNERDGGGGGGGGGGAFGTTGAPYTFGPPARPPPPSLPPTLPPLPSPSAGSTAALSSVRSPCLSPRTSPRRFPRARLLLVSPYPPPLSSPWGRGSPRDLFGFLFSRGPQRMHLHERARILTEFRCYRIIIKVILIGLYYRRILRRHICVLQIS